MFSREDEETILRGEKYTYWKLRKRPWYPSGSIFSPSVETDISQKLCLLVLLYYPVSMWQTELDVLFSEIQIPV